MNKTRLAKYVTLAASALGAAAVVTGLVFDQATLMSAGLSCWMLVALVLTYGNRLKLHQVLALHQLQLRNGQQQAEQMLHLLAGQHQQLDSRLQGVARTTADVLHMQLRCHESIQQTLQVIAREVRILDEDEMPATAGQAQGAAQRVWQAVSGMTTALDAARRSQEELAGQASQSLSRLQGTVVQFQARFEEDCQRALAFIQQDANLIDLTQRSLQWLKYETVQEVESLLQLQRMYPETVTAPLLGGWAMDPAAMLAILKLIIERRPGVIVECGSGTSSVWIAHALRSIGHGRLISLDQSAEYAAKTLAELARLGLQDWVEVRVGGLCDVELGGETFHWYDTAVLAGIESVDVLIVDGPPGSTQPLARYPALPLLADCLSGQACVIVDDAKRQDERKMMARWRREYHQLGKPMQMASRTRLLEWNVAASPSVQEGGV